MVHVFGFHRFLKVAVIGKVLLQSSGLMKTEAVTKKSVKMIWTHPRGRGLALPIKFSFLLLCGYDDILCVHDNLTSHEHCVLKLLFF